MGIYTLNKNSQFLYKFVRFCLFCVTGDAFTEFGNYDHALRCFREKYTVKLLKMRNEDTEDGWVYLIKYGDNVIDQMEEDVQKNSLTG